MAEVFELAMDRSEIDEEDFSPTELAILDKLEEGRGTPAYLASELDREQPYIRNLLSDLVRLELVEKVHRGLYELAGDGGEDRAPVTPDGLDENAYDNAAGDLESS